MIDRQSRNCGLKDKDLNESAVVALTKRAPSFCCAFAKLRCRYHQPLLTSSASRQRQSSGRLRAGHNELPDWAKTPTSTTFPSCYAVGWNSTLSTQPRRQVSCRYHANSSYAFRFTPMVSQEPTGRSEAMALTSCPYCFYRPIDCLRGTALVQATAPSSSRHRT